MPEFRFGRLLLRAIEETDLPIFLSFLQDADVVEYLGMAAFPTTLEEELSWYEKALKAPLWERPLAICIQDEEGSPWRLIGNCSFKKIDEQARHAELGLLIGDKREWNKGYGTEAMQALQWLGFTELNLNKLYLRVFAGNKGGIRAYEKAGFIHEGRLRQERFYQGKYDDSLMLSVLRSEWQERQQDQKG